MIINRYLTKEVTNTLLAVVVVLMLAFMTQQIVRYLNYVAVGKIPTTVLMYLIGFEIPYLLALLLPLGLYLGILLAYGRLYADHEMAILQLCGFDQGKVFRITGVMALMVATIVWVLMLWVNPDISVKRQHIMEGDEATNHLVQTLIPGRFQVSPDGRHVMYVEKLSRDHERAESVFVAVKHREVKDEESKRWMIVFANQGYQDKDKASGETYFVTTDGYRYEGVPGHNDYRIIQFKKYALRLAQNEIRSTHEQSEALPTLTLIDRYQEPKSAAELQWRVSVGLSAFFLALLAVPLSAVKPRRGRFLVLLPAVIVYVIYVHLLIVSRHWVEQGSLSPEIGLWWVHGLILSAIAVVVIAKQRFWSRA